MKGNKMKKHKALVEFYGFTENHIYNENDLELQQPSGTKNSTITDNGICTDTVRMGTYIGTKIVLATPMHEVDFLIKHKGLIGEEAMLRETQPGYLVQYEDGYKSWSPKAVFERCYREVTEQEKRMMY